MAALLIGLVALLSATPTAAVPARGQTAGSAQVATVNKNAELVKTLAIGRRAGDEREVVMTMPPSQLGDLLRVDRLKASMEFEVTICVHETNPRFEGYPCVGKVYGYNPTIAAQIVLAPSAGARSDRETLPVSDVEKLECSQKIPHRNRHCVLAIEDGSLDIPEQGLPCPLEACHLNVVAEAYHEDAKAGQKVVVGSSDREKDIKQNRASLNVVRLRPGTADVNPIVVTQRSSRAIAITDEGANMRDRVIYSVPIRDVQEGDQFFVDSKLVARIGHLPYNARIVQAMYLTDSPGGIDRGQLADKASGHRSEFGKKNGSTCTKGKSAYVDPCTSRKVGAVVIAKTVQETLYMNLVVSSEAQILDSQRYRKGSKAKVTTKGFLRVYRYDAPQ